MSFQEEDDDSYFQEAISIIKRTERKSKNFLRRCFEIGSQKAERIMKSLNGSQEHDVLEERVELHCHTDKSEMDGVDDVRSLMIQAAVMEQKALAITDHGNIQAFSDAFHSLSEVRKNEPDFKVIYGMEGYLVDDMDSIVTNSRGQSLEDAFVVVDMETTGLSATKSDIIEIGAVKVVNGELADCFSSYVRPKEPLREVITELTGIADQMLEDAPSIEEILPEFIRFCEGAVLTGYSVGFDMRFLKQKANDLGITFDHTSVDIMSLAKTLLPEMESFSLSSIAEVLLGSYESPGKEVDEAGCISKIFLKLVEMLKQQGITDLDTLQKYGKGSQSLIKRTWPHHVTMLVKDEVGMRNLSCLVSLSQDQFCFNKTPKIPKSLLIAYREGLLIGSACREGELYQAILNGETEEDLLEKASFYDYLEIQPADQDMDLLHDSMSDVDSITDLINIRKRIISLGEKTRKLVVATGNVHFLNPDDWEEWSELRGKRGFRNADMPVQLHLKTTEEMLKDFSFLPPEKAYEVVVKNTNRIADMIGDVEPDRSNIYPPVIENSYVDLSELCYKKAHELYGDNLPDIVEKRLKIELDAMKENGYAGVYVIVQKFADKSIRAGYPVGVRGLVGSSFVALTAGITDVNPLPPHYICRKCHYSDFNSKTVIKHRGGCGYDLPDKNCPVCGTPLRKEGFDISSEVFMGVDGKKEPFINLNFSGQVLDVIKPYAEELFGEGKCFLSGTPDTTAGNLLYGYVQKNTTNDREKTFRSEHDENRPFDYDLLKFNLIRHDDLTMLHRLANETGFDPKDVPFDDAKVMALFHGTAVLGITPDQIGGTQLGCIGIPEFGNDYAMQMLSDTRPKEFSQLVKIVGLNHATGAWLGNANELIARGQATISTVIATRDDIMAYLIDIGMEVEEAFQIMEAVRKGNVAKREASKWAEWKADMKNHGVPDWYIRSCEKMEYLFPRAHAAAYAMMAWRIAYYKLHYPQAFYQCWFAMRAKGVSHEKLFRASDVVKEHLKEYRNKEALTEFEWEEYAALRVAEEMYARGVVIDSGVLSNRS